MTGLSIFIFIVSIFLILWVFRKGLPLFHYLYLIRIPLIGSLILFLFPIIAQWIAPQFLQNLFVMESSVQLVLVMVFATLSSITLVSSIKNILVLREPTLNENNTFRVVRTILNITLFLPTWISLTVNSLVKNPHPNVSWLSFFMGIIISSLLLMGVLIYDWRRIQIFSFLDQKIQANNLTSRRQSFYLVEIFLGLTVYLLAILLNWPKPSGETLLSDNLQAPTLLYALLIIWIMTLLIGVITYYFDKIYLRQYQNIMTTYLASYLYSFRVPVILLLILFSGLMYWLLGVDHFFKLQESNVIITDYQQDFKTAIGNRLCPEDFKQGKNCQTPQTLIVIAASGGGIQASGWTAHVLAKLQDEIGTDFSEHIGLISSASGGSVGTMFYLEQLQNRILKNPKFMIKNATDDWLDSVGWGLAFPDLFRGIGLPFMLKFKFNEDYKYLDRGYALEKDWKRNLQKNEQQQIATLDDWYQQSLKGEIPIPVFNSTLVENGRRFLISPLKFLPGQMIDYLTLLEPQSNQQSLEEKDLSYEIQSSPKKQQKIQQSKALDFRTLYNNCGEYGNQPCTLEVTTAARLSATFPYVSPMARNDKDNQLKDNQGRKFIQNYHMADGGYFDNAGAFTALEWLDQLLEQNREALNIKKVIFVQINAFPEDVLTSQQIGDKGFMTVLLGPLTALNGVRNSTQIARNLEAIGLLKNRWANDSQPITIQPFAFTFPSQDLEGNPYQQPLSWRLTQTQKDNLEKAWNTDIKIRTTVDCIKAFWQNKESQLNPKCLEVS